MASAHLHGSCPQSTPHSLRQKELNKADQEEAPPRHPRYRRPERERHDGPSRGGEISRLKQLTVHVIEVGYASDIDHEGKRDAKTAQHEALVAELKKAGFEVKYHEPFTLVVRFTVRGSGVEAYRTNAVR